MKLLKFPTTTVRTDADALARKLARLASTNPSAFAMVKGTIDAMAMLVPERR